MEQHRYIESGRRDFRCGGDHHGIHIPALRAGEVLQCLLQHAPVVPDILHLLRMAHRLDAHGAVHGPDLPLLRGPISPHGTISGRSEGGVCSGASKWSGGAQHPQATR